MVRVVRFSHITGRYAWARIRFSDTRAMIIAYDKGLHMNNGMGGMKVEKVKQMTYLHTHTPMHVISLGDWFSFLPCPLLIVFNSIRACAGIVCCTFLHSAFLPSRTCTQSVANGSLKHLSLLLVCFCFTIDFGSLKHKKADDLFAKENTMLAKPIPPFGAEGSVCSGWHGDKWSSKNGSFIFPTTPTVTVIDLFANVLRNRFFWVQAKTFQCEFHNERKKNQISVPTWLILLGKGWRSTCRKEKKREKRGTKNMPWLISSQKQPSHHPWEQVDCAKESIQMRNTPSPLLPWESCRQQ